MNIITSHTTKLKQSLAVAQAGVLMLGIISMAVPATALATSVPNNEHHGFVWHGDHENDHNKLIVNKVIVGNDTAQASNFSFTISNGDETTDPQAFTNTGAHTGSATVHVDKGDYTVTETDPGTNWSVSYAGDCALTPEDNDDEDNGGNHGWFWHLFTFLHLGDWFQHHHSGKFSFGDDKGSNQKSCTITNTYTAPQACTVVSDTGTLANGNPSVATYIHPIWTSIPGATWIWKTALVDTGLVPDTTTFTKTISLTGAPSSATLTIAADNTYTVLVNGVAPTCDGSQLDNFSAADTCAVTNLVSGNNTLTFTVTNTAGDSDPHANPAGLDYSLAITGASCGDVPPPTPNTLKVHILKYLMSGQSEVAASGELPAFPMTATWNATNIGGGTGSYTLNSAGFGGAGAYAADTAAMSVPADYSTNEVPDGTTVLAHDAECQPGAYRLVGYQTGDTLGAALNSAPSLTIPSFTGLTADKYVVVVNEKCSDVLTPHITVVASKVMCTNEADLPNWGTGGATIDATTAADWVEEHPSCSLEDGWSFQWGNQGAPDGGNATVGEVDGYTTFGPTVAGVTTTTIPMTALGEGTEFHLREVLQAGYIPFTFNNDPEAPNGDNVSAEFYCTGDALNYDNYDFIRNPEAGSTYYCVAFNAPKAVKPTNHPHTPQVQTGGGGSGGDTNPQVLGESTSTPEVAPTCEPLLNSFLKQGWKNDPEQVKKLQKFLADYLHINLPQTGFFGPATFNAVKLFQKTEWADVLKPWFSIPGSGVNSQDNPTGFVYLTTKWRINNLSCPGSEEFPSDLK